ncbi:MAG: acetyltransferase including N-acetylase of ribosomal protein-like protein [Frankiales bacterium]|nr:acetyltransferase including N-acetylase of ribosomal protein-like protein [Frankiales bacterium]
MTALPTGQPLLGDVVRLDLLTEADLPALAPLLADPVVYASGYVMHRRPTTPEDGVAVARERFLAQQGQLDGKGGGRTAYCVRLVADGPLGAEGTVVGTSSLLEADLGNEKTHVGSTLYGSRWWGTAVNPECKLLLLQHAFDDLGYGRVKIQTDLLNTRSQAAIAKLGAVREGVLRRDVRREDGTWRDTVVFSVLADEWPAVRQGLQARLASSP